MGLTATDLRVMLGGRPVIDGLSATFEPGSVTVLLGPNGAGKSTLLRALLALLPLAGGTVALDGEAVATLDPLLRARRLGYLPQIASLAWNVPARMVVELGRSPHRSPFAALSPADRAAVDAALALTDTTRFADRPINALSGGECARVMLARVLAGEPAWLLVDEPLASLDPAHQIDMLDRLRSIADAGRGVILVVHDLNHAARIADRILLMKEGRALAAGAAPDVLQPAVLEAAYGVRFDRIDGPDHPILLPRRDSRVRAAASLPTSPG